MTPAALARSKVGQLEIAIAPSAAATTTSCAHLDWQLIDANFFSLSPPLRPIVHISPPPLPEVKPVDRTGSGQSSTELVGVFLPSAGGGSLVGVASGRLARAANLHSVESASKRMSSDKYKMNE